MNATGRLLELDPLSEDAGLIAARAHLELGDEEAARRGLESTEAAPIFVEALRMMPQGMATRIEGDVVGNAAEPGSVVRLRFTFYGDQRILGMETVVAEAPVPGERDGFEVSVQARASGYRYELIP